MPLWRGNYVVNTLKKNLARVRKVYAANECHNSRNFTPILRWNVVQLAVELQRQPRYQRVHLVVT
jgi:hypothetical protein